MTRMKKTINKGLLFTGAPPNSGDLIIFYFLLFLPVLPCGTKFLQVLIFCDLQKHVPTK